MHGRSNFKKSIQKDRRAYSRERTRTKPYVEVGNWRFEEDLNGDLVIINIETNKIVKFLTK